MKKWLASANEAFFGWGSATSFGLFRIVFGSIVLVNLFMLLAQFDVWFTERGLIPISFASMPGNQAGIPRLDVLHGVTDARITMTVFVITTIAAFLTTIGLFSRVASIVLFVGLISIHHRTMDILHSGDTLMRAYCFILMIGPSGAACSVDRLIRLWKGKEPPGHRIVSLWPQRFVQAQLAIVYFTTVWQKAYGSKWLDGTATWYTSQLHEFERFPVPAFFNSQPMVAFTTYFTLIVELALATLVFAKPLRKWVLLAGLMLHVGIEYMMNIPLFAFVIVVGYICHYDGEEIKGWALRWGQRLKKYHLTLWHPRQMDEGPVAALEAMDALDLVSYEQGRTSQWAGDAKGQTPAPFGKAYRRSIGAWFLFPFGLGWPQLLRKGERPETPREEGEEACATA